MRKLSLILLILIYKLGLVAQAPVSKGSSEILHHLKKLNTLGSVLYIAAHPDDENTRLLSYLANEKRFRTAYLSLTRGDGGQNLIGKEQAELLGLIRTQELLAARRVDGAEQLFTRANDFGYSKNPEETFSFWNKDSVLYDVVLAIRKFKPDVIICRFPTTGEGGHGHHTASAILALEAFDAAADPTKFPDQLKYTEVWQAKRILWNTFNFGTTNTTSPDQIKLDVGVYNSLLGKGYGEIAAESRSMHKSQGFGSAKQRGSNIEYFKFLKGEELKSDLFEGVNSTWGRINQTAAIQKTVDAIIKSFDMEFPAKSIAALTDLYKSIAALSEKEPYIQYWKKIKLNETEQLILWCSGLFLEATSADYMAIPGEDINITTQVVNRSSSDVKLKRVSFLNQWDTLPAMSLKQNELYTFKRKEKLSNSISYSNPYWLNEKHSSGRYTVKDMALIGKPENDGIAKVVFEISINDLTLSIERSIVYKSTDPVKGEVYRPLEIVPPVTINFSEKVIVYTHSPKKVIHLTLTAKANKASVTGKLKLNTHVGWAENIDKPEFIINNKGDEVIFNVELVADQKAESTVVSAEVEVDGKLYSNSIKRIEYDHIPYQFILSDAEIKLINADIKKGDLTIGYIPGAGDDVAACLKQIGYNVTILTDDLLLNEDLSKYSAIVTGVRAYNTNDRLQVHYNKLMEYIKAGGNLVVQYNTNNRIGPVVAKISPYPLTISRDRVTDELAKVSFVKNDHPALNFPNAITNADFDNWIQERGIYFANDLDKAYQPILEMNDPNEKTSNGSLIITPYGKGNFVYTGLAFFRELPAGVPGAYRLFVNLLSLPKNK
ncbi:MAG: PIG-L family deacetylase [Bacteroidia bacterium]|nr:PIG-L family deacetylase [Bacteroidia bacterium]